MPQTGNKKISPVDTELMTKATFPQPILTTQQFCHNSDNTFLCYGYSSASHTSRSFFVQLFRRRNCNGDRYLDQSLHCLGHVALDS